jgi:hypothetical protein
MPRLRRMIGRKGRMREAAVKAPGAEVTLGEIREIVHGEMEALAKELKAAIAKSIEVKEDKTKSDPLKKLEYKNVPFHYAQTKALEKNVLTVHESWAKGLKSEMESFTKSINSMQAYIQGLEKALESKRRHRYKNLIMTLVNPFNWPRLVHPIEAYRNSAFATRRQLRAARAELQRLLTIKDLWLNICQQELAIINKYFAMVKKQPNKQTAAIFGKVVTDIAMKHFELRNLAMTMVFGKDYQKQIRAMHKVMGTKSGNAPSYVLAEVKKTQQPEFVRKALADALKELQRM